MTKAQRALGVGLICFSAVIAIGGLGLHYRSKPLIPRSLLTTIHGAPQQNLVTTQPRPRPTQRIPDQPVPILMYHYVRSVSEQDDQLGYDLSIEPELFNDQLDAIKAAGYQTVTPSQYAIGDLPKQSIILSFDDGYAGFYSEALPRLIKHKMTAVVFVVSGFLDDEAGRYLTRTQVKSIADQGFEIGSHTVSHLNLVTADARRRQDELLISRQVLEQLTGKRVQAVAYPAGKVDEATAKIADYVGYTIGVTTQAGSAQPSSEHLLLPRVRVRGGDTPESLLAAIERANSTTPTETEGDLSDPL